MEQFERSEAAFQFIEQVKVSYINADIASSANLSQPEYDESMSDAPSRQEVDAKIAASAAETRASFEALRVENADFRTEMRTELAELRSDMRAGFAEIRTEIHKAAGETHKWMIATVIGLFLGFGGLFLAMSNALKPQSQSATQAAPIVINVPASVQASPPPVTVPKK